MRLRSVDVEVPVPRAPIKEARALLAEYLALRDSMLAPPSASGGQLEALKNGMAGNDDGADWRATQTANARAVRFMDLARVWALLTVEEQRVVELQNTPKPAREIGSARFVIHARRRTVPESELHRVEVPIRVLEPGQPVPAKGREAVFLLTHDGAEFVQNVAPVVDEEGKVLAEDRVLVEERVALTYSHEDIAAEMAATTGEVWTTYMVRNRVQSAMAKVRAEVATWR